MVGDIGGEMAVDFGDFLKNLDVDLLGGSRGGRDGEPLEVEEEKVWGRGTGGDCGEGVSSWGNMKREMNKREPVECPCRAEGEFESWWVRGGHRYPWKAGSPEGGGS